MNKKMKISPGFLCIYLVFAVSQAHPTTKLPSVGDQMDDMIVTQGLLDLMKGHGGKKREFHRGLQKWTKRGEEVKIPYTVSGLGSSISPLLSKAFRSFDELTCIKFTPRRGEADYIEFTGGERCASIVGKQLHGGKQTLTLGSQCNTFATVIHELMHAIGFLHEQSRPDRDSYVNVFRKNIQTGKEGQFANYASNLVDVAGEPYDFNSVMHYKRKEFSKNGLDTIEAKTDGNMPLGNDKFFSKTDLVQINKIYNCPLRYQHLSELVVDIYTSAGWYTGTSADVYIDIFDKNGDSTGEWKVGNDFEQNSRTQVEKFCAKLFTLKQVKVRQDDQALWWDDDWHLDKLVVKDKTTGTVTTFKCDCWLDGNSKTLNAA